MLSEPSPPLPDEVYENKPKSIELLSLRIHINILNIVKL